MGNFDSRHGHGLSFQTGTDCPAHVSISTRPLRLHEKRLYALPGGGSMSGMRATRYAPGPRKRVRRV
jgi:hypothetical protein